MRYPFRMFWSGHIMSSDEAVQRLHITFVHCPFCFNPYPVIRMTHSVNVLCTNCGAEGPEIPKSAVPSSDPMLQALLAVEYWNKRLPPERYERK